jgi:DNA-binding GntR family transcriptional regulator
VCAGLCAARDDRETEVIPALQAEIDRQITEFDDVAAYVPNARRFHEQLVARCGNEPMILLIGSLELIWSAHESSVWSGEGDRSAESTDDSATARLKTRRAALRDHQRLLDAIRAGDSARAVRIAGEHVSAARSNTLARGSGGPPKTIEARLISNMDRRPWQTRKVDDR